MWRKVGLEQKYSKSEQIHGNHSIFHQFLNLHGNLEKNWKKKISFRCPDDKW